MGWPPVCGEIWGPDLKSGLAAEQSGSKSQMSEAEQSGERGSKNRVERERSMGGEVVGAGTERSWTPVNGAER